MELSSYFGFISHNNYIKIISLIIISTLFASIYACSSLYPKNSYNIAIKISSIASLILIVFFADLPLSDNTASNIRILLITALCFHLIGDTVIELSDNLLHCLPIFMIGHILYSYIFYQDIMHGFTMYTVSSFIDVSFRHYLALFIALSFGGFMTYLLIPKISGFLLFGVIIYMLVLTFEVLFAIFHPDCRLGIPWILLGVSMYVISDFLLAYNEFVEPIYARVLLVWPLYYFAQVFIVFSLLGYHLKSI